MKLYFEVIKFIFNKIVRRYENGRLIKDFAESMGIAYIKFAQILATQNFGNLFTEKDRKLLSGICDNCNSIPFKQIEKTLEKEYGENLDNIFLSIDPNPIGAASISQVHKATLKNGDIVALKIKRKDITKTIEKDVARMKKIVNTFGKFVKFNNFTGGEQALNLYLKWIYEETDFNHEKENIKIYQEFADTVNGNIDDIKEIKIPKLYEDICTDNIIVMEYIPYKTINKIESTKENNEIVSGALNSYIKASFYALLNNKQVVFHGDPHSGNIYIDDEGNIGFLDMGLLFVISEEDTVLLKKFFFSAYAGNYEKLYDLLIPYGKMNCENKQQFKEDIKKYCKELGKKDITFYFTDMIGICLKYEFIPPTFIFCMAKAFICLNGINGFSNNLTTARELLQEQAIEYFLKRSLKDCEKIVHGSISLVPNLLKNSLKYGVFKGVTKEIAQDDNLYNKINDSLDNYKEMLDIMRSTRG